MENCAEGERLLSQPRKMLISSFTLQNGTLITPLLLFYLPLGLFVTKIHRFVVYTPRKCFNSLVQSAVDARRQGDQNPNSNVVAEKNEASSQQLLLLLDLGLEPTHCNEVPH